MRYKACNISHFHISTAVKKFNITFHLQVLFNPKYFVTMF